jgi:hypothetical protein
MDWWASVRCSYSFWQLYMLLMWSVTLCAAREISAHLVDIAASASLHSAGTQAAGDMQWKHTHSRDGQHVAAEGAAGDAVLAAGDVSTHTN